MTLLPVLNIFKSVVSPVNETNILNYTVAMSQGNHFLFIVNPSEYLVGYKPDMLHWTHDCSMIVVANEGEAAESADGQSFRNPEGSVSIIRFPGGMFGTHTVITLGFESFNPE